MLTELKRHSFTSFRFGVKPVWPETDEAELSENKELTWSDFMKHNETHRVNNMWHTHTHMQTYTQTNTTKHTHTAGSSLTFLSCHSHQLWYWAWPLHVITSALFTCKYVLLVSQTFHFSFSGSIETEVTAQSFLTGSLWRELRQNRFLFHPGW